MRFSKYWNSIRNDFPHLKRVMHAQYNDLSYNQQFENLKAEEYQFPFKETIASKIYCVPRLR